MLRDRTFLNKKIATAFHQERFYPSGNYTWRVPEGCESVDVFLVGAGGGAKDTMPGGGGYTKTFKNDTSGYRDGGPINVSPGISISIIVGSGGVGDENYSTDGSYSQFMNSSYRANGGLGGTGSGSSSKAGDGGSGAASWHGYPGTDGSDGSGTGFTPGSGQGHTTRDFGDPSGKRNAGAGSCNRAEQLSGGESDYTEGSGGESYNNDPNPSNNPYTHVSGGGGYGGGGSGASYPQYVGNGGDGTVLIRYYAYK